MQEQYMSPRFVYKFKAAEKIEIGDYVSVNEEGRIAKAISISTTDGIALGKASRRGALVSVIVFPLLDWSISAL